MTKVSSPGTTRAITTALIPQIIIMFLVWCPSLLVFGLDLRLRICVATFRQLIASTHYRPSPPEIDLDYLHDKYNRPEVGTGEWIFEDDRYKAWRESRESKLLWLCGGPGTGKTTLAKRVAAEFLKELHNPPRRVKLIYYFVSPELRIDGISAIPESPQAELAKIASDLLYGILQQDETLFDSYRAELGKQGDRFFSNPGSLWKVLRKAVRDCQTDSIHILIDGIDGLKEGLFKELIGRILDLMKIRTVKVFLSSRDVPHVSNILSGNLPGGLHKCAKINLDIDSPIREDVKSFINRSVDDWGWDVNAKNKVKEILLAKSEGTFLWASLVVRNLECFSSGPDFDAFLKTSPSELQDVYRKILSSLTEREGSKTVLSMIHSVALALRPLTFGELGYILARMEGKAKTGEFSHGRTGTKIPSRAKEEIMGYVRSSLGFLRATDTTVSLVHHTAREYLFDESHNEELPIPLEGETDLTVSWECFQYLHHAFADTGKSGTGGPSGRDNESRGSSSRQDHQEEEVGETVGEVERKDPQHVATVWPYLRYAAESWFIHARRSVEIPENRFYDDSTRNWFQYQFFETHDIIRKSWIELCGDQEMEVLAGDQTKLHIAVSLGLLPLVEKALLDSPKGTDSDWSPLHLAAKFISGAYRILIGKVRPPLLTKPDQDGNTPLHEAVIYGHFPMLEALVKRFTEYGVSGSEINKQNQYGNTPLHLAFQFDHPEIVGFLVEKGADKTIKNKAQVTALEWGKEFGRDDSLDTLRQAQKIREKPREGIMPGPADGPLHDDPLQPSSQAPQQDSRHAPRLTPRPTPHDDPLQSSSQAPQQDSQHAPRPTPRPTPHDDLPQPTPQAPQRDSRHATRPTPRPTPHDDPLKPSSQAPQQDSPHVPRLTPRPTPHDDPLQPSSQAPQQDPQNAPRPTPRPTLHVAPPAPVEALPGGPPRGDLEEIQFQAGSSIGYGETKVITKSRRGRCRVLYVAIAICAIGILLAVIMPFTRGHT